MPIVDEESAMMLPATPMESSDDRGKGMSSHAQQHHQTPILTSHIPATRGSLLSAEKKKMQAPPKPKLLHPYVH